MAGKSTYLRQVALIALMAHVGCPVPAKFSAMQVVDRLLTRLGTSDCIETSSSSFLMEMQASRMLQSHCLAKDNLMRRRCSIGGAAFKVLTIIPEVMHNIRAILSPPGNADRNQKDD